MGSIGQYIFRSTLGAFILVLVSLTATIWITQALRDVDLMTNRGQTILIFLGITSLIIPVLVLVIAPIAMVISVGHVLNKLSTDSELIVMNAAGMSPWRLFKPFLATATVVSLMVALLGAWGAPASLRFVRNWATEVRADLVSNIVQPGRFMGLERGMTFHIRERRPNGQLVGIFVDDRTNPEQQATFLAEEGEIMKTDRGTFLLLKNGTVQRREKNQRDPTIVVYDRYAFDLSRLSSTTQQRNMSTRERYIWELMWPDPDDKTLTATMPQRLAELNDRILAPIYPFAFVIIAFAYLGPPRTTRQGRGAAMAGALLGVAVLRIIGFASIVAALSKPWAIWIPYGTIALTIVFGLIAISRGSLAETPAFVTSAMSAIGALTERFTRRFATSS
jgi:lipopolysaccharide export system permease protein